MGAFRGWLELGALDGYLVHAEGLISPSSVCRLDGRLGLSTEW
jgi:hypothetical protein